METDHCSHILQLLRQQKTLPLQKLRVDQTYHLSHLQPGISQFKSTLKVLHLCGVHCPISDDLHQLSFLEELLLSGCLRLVTFPTALYTLPKLEKLNVYFCDALLAFPNGISQLPQLQCFDVYDCRNLRSLPEDLLDAPSLKHIELDELRSLQQLPQSFAPAANKRKGLHIVNPTPTVPGLAHLWSDSQ